MAEAARQLELSKPRTAVCEVVVREVLILESAAPWLSGGVGSMLMEVTTKTSLSNGDKFKSTLPCVKVSTALSIT